MLTHLPPFLFGKIASVLPYGNIFVPYGIFVILTLGVGLIADVRLGCRREEPGAGHAFLFRRPVDEPEHAGREGHIHAHGLFRLGVDGDELVQGAFRDVDFKFAAVRFGLGLGRRPTGRGG